jgi:hypothetical protein
VIGGLTLDNGVVQIGNCTTPQTASLSPPWQSPARLRNLTLPSVLSAPSDGKGVGMPVNTVLPLSTAQTDPDGAKALKGIAITSADNSNGK